MHVLVKTLQKELLQDKITFGIAVKNLTTFRNALS